MAEIRNMLLAVDGSEYALKAVRFAADLARKLEANIEVITVHSNELFNVQLMGVAGMPVMAPTSAVSIDEFREQIEASTEKDVFEACRKALGTLPSSPRFRQAWGHAGEIICEQAKNNGFDLIVIGSRGRSTFSKILLGSVSLQVLNHAPCPVTVVR